jgi:hypothetical protein
MPWEIDNALLTFTQLKKSYYYLPTDVNVTVETVLNLSSKFVDWNQSILPKDFFISKYNDISLLLNDYKHIKRIYDGDEIYGFLNLQKESISKEVDYYIGVCPDVYFSEHLLYLLIKSTKVIKDDYFVITPQIYKKWDFTWDEITDPNYLNIPYSQWNNLDIFKTFNEIQNSVTETSLVPVAKSKWAWWFDIYNKNFYENLCPVHSDWEGYGPWDFYSILLTEHLKNNFKNINFQQYVLRGQTILDTSSGTLKEMGYKSYYKKFLKILPDHAPEIQRKKFESKMNEHLNYGIKLLIQKNILK